jgi:hypothetical protein
MKCRDCGMGIFVHGDCIACTPLTACMTPAAPVRAPHGQASHRPPDHHDRRVMPLVTRRAHLDTRQGGVRG